MPQHTNEAMEALLRQLLTLTLQLEESIHADEPDAQDWVRLLDERMQVINQISSLQEQGEQMTDDQKQRYIGKVNELDSQLIPAMELKKFEVQKRINNLNKSKMVNQQYMGGYGYNPYGSFFDKKK